MFYITCFSHQLLGKIHFNDTDSLKKKDSCAGCLSVCLSLRTMSH